VLKTLCGTPRDVLPRAGQPCMVVALRAWGKRTLGREGLCRQLPP
jgi:hypothetical protein